DQVAGQRCEASGRNLVYTGRAIAHSLRELRSLIPLAIAEGQQRAATLRQLLDGMGEVAAEIGFLLIGSRGLRHEFQDRGVDSVIEFAPLLPPIQQTLVANSPH